MRKAGGDANKKRRGINGYFFYTQFKRTEIGEKLTPDQQAKVDAIQAEYASTPGKKLTSYFAVGKLIHNIYAALPEAEKLSYNVLVKAYNVYFMEENAGAKRSVASWLKLSQKERDAYKAKADAADAAATTTAATAAKAKAK